MLLPPPFLSLSGRRLGLQDFGDADSGSGLLVPCVGWAGWANAVRRSDVHRHQRFSEGGVQHFEQVAPNHRELLPQELHAPAAVQAEQHHCEVGRPLRNCRDDKAGDRPLHRGQQSPPGTSSERAAAPAPVCPDRLNASEAGSSSLRRSKHVTMEEPHLLPPWNPCQLWAWSSLLPGCLCCLCLQH